MGRGKKNILGKMDKELSIKNKYYKYFPFKFLVEKIIRNRTERIVNAFDGFIKKGEKVLDIGAGAGWTAREIQKRKNAKVILLDVIDFNQTDLKLVLYDGEKIPFSDNSFDSVLLIYVLHHAENPLKVLKEAKRVSGARIIIFEDTYISLSGKIFLYLWDFITNLPSFLVKPFGEKMSFNFKKVSEWKKIFKRLQLKIIFQEEFQSKKIVGHVLFVLKTPHHFSRK